MGQLPLSPFVKWGTPLSHPGGGDWDVGRSQPPGWSTLGHCPSPRPTNQGCWLAALCRQAGFSQVNSPGEPPRPTTLALGAWRTSLMEAPVLSHVGITGFTC